MLTNDSKTVLILGARGRFGLAAVHAFSQAGWQVLAQVRPAAAGLQPADTTGPALPGVSWRAQELTDTAALAAAADGAGVVVHALSPPYTHRQWRAQVPALMDAAIRVSRQLGATLMLPGNVYNFGASMPALLHEDTPQAATTVKGRIRIGLEQQLAAATRDGRMKAVVIRAGDFFGSGRGSWLDLVMVAKLPRGKLVLPGPLNVATAWAYLPDLARSFVQVAARREQLPAFETLHFGGYSLSGQDWLEVLTDLAWEQGWLPASGQLRLGSLPWPLIRAGSLVVPTWESLCEMRYLWNTPHRLASDKLTTLLGSEPHTPLAQAVQSALGNLGLLGQRRTAGLARA